MSNGWRTVSLCLGAVICVQLYRDCTRAPAAPQRTAERTRDDRTPSRSRTSSWDEHANRADSGDPPPQTAADDAPRLYGIKVPPWARFFTPQPGESIKAYRDRMMPLALAAVAPQRARVARGLADFTAAAHLDAQQRAELDAAAQHAANQIEDRVLSAIGNGELDPSQFKPMAAISLARDVLDTIDKDNERFTKALRDDQRAQLAQHPFDFADYLAFSTHWEDVLKVLD